MKVGDLVKVSNNGFTAIGYIKEVTRSGYYVVHYFSQMRIWMDTFFHRWFMVIRTEHRY